MLAKLKKNAVLIIGLIVIGITVLGFFPHNKIDFRAMKQISSQWYLMLFVAVFFIKNLWIRLFLVWSIIRTAMIIYNPNFAYYQISKQTLDMIFVYILFYQALSNQIHKYDLRKLLNGICIITLIQSLWIVMQFFGFWPFIWPLNMDKDNTIHVFISKWPGFRLAITKPGLYFNMTGLMSNRDMTGAALAMGVPAFCRRKWEWCLLLIWPTLLVTKCLGGIIPAGIITVLYIWCRLPKARYYLIALCLGTFLVYMKHFEDWTALQDMSGRLPIWKKVIEKIIPFRPIVGWGAGQFKAVFPPIHRHLLGGEYSSVNFFQAHNDYIQACMEYGLIGLSIVGGFVVSIFRKWFKNRNFITNIGILGLLTGLINCGGNFLFYTTTAIMFFAYLIVLEKGSHEKNIVCDVN